VQTQVGEIGVGIVADQIGAGLPAIVEGGLDPAGVLHDVAVGEREAIGGEHDPRAGRRLARPPLCPAACRCSTAGHTASAAAITARE
jgi:hypothetical protein